jgi:hypothetical protein
MDIKRNGGGDGWVIRTDNGLELIFSTESEARKAMARVDTAKAIVAAVKSLSLVTDTAADLEAEYFDAGTFVDDDVAAIGLTAADVASCITLLQQVNNLMTNQVTSLAMYRTTLNKVRRT